MAKGWGCSQIHKGIKKQRRPEIYILPHVHWRRRPYLVSILPFLKIFQVQHVADNLEKFLHKGQKKKKRSVDKTGPPWKCPSSTVQRVCAPARRRELGRSLLFWRCLSHFAGSPWRREGHHCSSPSSAIVPGDSVRSETCPPQPGSSDPSRDALVTAMCREVEMFRIVDSFTSSCETNLKKKHWWVYTITEPQTWHGGK